MIEANEAVKAPWLKAYGDLPSILNILILLCLKCEWVAKQYPDYIAFEFLGKSTTYGEFIANIRRTSQRTNGNGHQRKRPRYHLHA